MKDCFFAKFFFPARRELRIVCMAALGSILALHSCKDIEEPDPISSLLLSSGGDKIGIVSSDLGGAGHFSTMTTDGVAALSFVNTHSDATARYAEGRVYVINRLGRDSVQVLNPELFYLPELEFSTGIGSNPHDLALAGSGAAYISLYERNTILIVQPQTGLPTGSIDLSAWADGDGVPETDSLYYHEGRLYAALQRLDRNHPTLIFPPVGDSYILEIDTASSAVLAAHLCPAGNPFGKPKRVDIFGERMLIYALPGLLGFNQQLDGGVAAFSLDSRSFRPGLLYSEATAGGDILDVAIKNETTGYALVLFADFSMSLQVFNPSNGSRTGTLAFYPANGGFVSELLLHPNGFLYVAQAAASNSGVTIYDTNSGNIQLTPFPIEIGLRPTGFVRIP